MCLRIFFSLVTLTCHGTVGISSLQSQPYWYNICSSSWVYLRKHWRNPVSPLNITHLERRATLTTNVVLLFLWTTWRFVISSKQNLSRIERRMLEQPGFKSLGLQIYNVNFGPIITTSVRNQKSRALLYWGHKICLNNKFYWCCKHWVFSIEYSWVDH